MRILRRGLASAWIQTAKRRTITIHGRLHVHWRRRKKFYLRIVWGGFSAFAIVLAVVGFFLQDPDSNSALVRCLTPGYRNALSAYARMRSGELLLPEDAGFREYVIFLSRTGANLDFRDIVSISINESKVIGSREGSPLQVEGVVVFKNGESLPWSDRSVLDNLHRRYVEIPLRQWSFGLLIGVTATQVIALGCEWLLSE